ncbi:MAG: murein biosynthesis integral membrane protein MurJ [Rickettsiales bacterium]|jgi:putative peptidoglycan lipid II flippase|nr:murein biosynthesis integral membrane protein MurJ [Rickettsiales bacterium]
MSLSKNIFKVGAWTGISRILGFARDMLIAAVLGAGRLSDIFLAAFRLPNLFRDLLGEGALSLVFVPMFAEYKNRKKIGPFFAGNVFSWLMAILLVITILGEILMPFIILTMAPGFADDPGKIEMTVVIARMMFFYVIFICGVAFLSGVLNAFSEFATVAAMPALLNVFMIGGLVCAMHFGARASALYILAAAVVLSGVAQMIILWGRLRARAFGLRMIRPRMTPHIKTMIRRIGMSFIGSGFYQINILAGTIIASYQSGAISWLYYADRMVQLPFAMIGLAAGTVLLTSISDALAEKNFHKIYAQQNTSLRNVMMFTLPCVAGLFVLAQPIMQFLFERGAWTHESTLAVAAAIMIQSLALPAMTTSQIFSRTIYASQDVKTPIKINIVTIILDIIIMVSLVGWLGYLVVPIATVAGGYIRNVWLRKVCESRGLFKIMPGTKHAMLAFGILSFAMGAGLWLVRDTGMISGLVALGLAIAAAGMVYLPAAWIVNKKLK